MQPWLQPIVTLPEARVVGFEALARWTGCGGVNPVQVFDHAARTGRTDALDRTCIDAAIASSLETGVPTGCMLAVNSEPSSAYVDRHHDAMLDRGAAQFCMVFELTERHLLQHPRTLLAKTAAIRADGFVIALDDVGAQAESLALLDVLAPEIVKLDLGLIQGQTHREQTRTLAAILAYQERSGALIVAEGIETDAHLERALAVGATLGQGYRFGRPHIPGSMSLTAVGPWRPQLVVTPHGWPSASTPASPFDVLTRDWHLTIRTARKEILTAFTRHIERQATDTVDPAIVLTALQDRTNLTPSTVRRYERLARTAPLVALFGRDVPPHPASGVRGTALEPADPLCAEWTVVALGAGTAAALIAREHHPQPSGTDEDRLFDFVITYDRTLVTAATRALLGRIP